MDDFKKILMESSFEILLKESNYISFLYEGNIYILEDKDFSTLEKVDESGLKPISSETIPDQIKALILLGKLDEIDVN